mmetsp:Transcript_34291/g.67418  ORF Transcript_34291/g.67418 Transcript_34291/m.67418 type:complete len:290 (-) Transcript_34291:194-1063(-)
MGNCNSNKATKKVEKRTDEVRAEEPKNADQRSHKERYVLENATTNLGADKPRFEFVPDCIDSAALEKLRAFEKSECGPGIDPSSTHFMKRSKAIAFVLPLNGTVYSLEQDFFMQQQGYNDLSGGCKRQYKKIQDSTLQECFAGLIHQFVDYYDLPKSSLILVQIQTSMMEGKQVENAARINRCNSITGQGIHTDGSDRALLLCINRENTNGAANQFHGSLDGEDPLCEPRVLQPGEGVFFKDNELFHYVTPGVQSFPEVDLKRTLILMHWPAEHHLVGGNNPNNRLGVR